MGTIQNHKLKSHGNNHAMARSEIKLSQSMVNCTGKIMQLYLQDKVVFEKQLDYLQIGSQRIEQFAVEIGAMDYGFSIHGILGMDFLLQAGAVLDLNEMKIEFR